MKCDTLVRISFSLAAVIAVAVTVASRDMREREQVAAAPSISLPVVKAPEVAKANPTESEDATAVVSGALTTRYASKSPDYIEAVFLASKKSLDQLGYFRTGETPGLNKVTLFARAHGDILVTLVIEKKSEAAKAGSAQDWVYVSIRYGDSGNAQKSQAIVAKISENLK